jgi:hypothetical protein
LYLVLVVLALHTSSPTTQHSIRWMRSSEQMNRNSSDADQSTRGMFDMQQQKDKKVKVSMPIYKGGRNRTMEGKSWLVILYLVALVTFTELYIPWCSRHLWSCSGNGVTSSAFCSVWTSPGWVRQWKHGKSILLVTHSKYSFSLWSRTRRATLGTGIPVYLMIFILSQLFQVALAWDAVGSYSPHSYWFDSSSLVS